MRKRTVTILALLAGVLAIGAPIVAALSIAHRQSMDEEAARAATMAHDLLRRADAMGDQAMAAYRGLAGDAITADPCSDRRLALMRQISLASSYLQAVGYVRDGRLLCSSLGRHGEGIVLGPAAYTSSQGARVRPAVDLGGGRSLVAFEKGGYLAALHSGSLLDIRSDLPDAGLGIYGASSGVRLAGRGAFDPAWARRLGGARRATFFDGQHLVAMERSSRYDLATYVAVPVARLRARLSAFVRVLLPLGIILGLFLSTLIYLLARQQTSVAAALRAALRRGEFELHYQPIVALDSGRMVGVEALLRWPRADGPPMRPALFIPAAEDCGLIQQVTRFVMSRVAAEAPAFLARYPGCYLSLNLSATDLHSDATVAALRRLASTPGIRAANIVVEVTEHSFVDAERAGRTVEAIRQLGIRVAIDDFGTGYSGLSHLTRLRTDYLKIDRVFVDTVGTDAATSEVALHIIRVARSLDMRLIAEGIETPAQAAFLREHGVEFGQGWLFHKAMPMPGLLAASPAA